MPNRETDQVTGVEAKGDSKQRGIDPKKEQEALISICKNPLHVSERDQDESQAGSERYIAQGRIRMQRASFLESSGMR
jgi:hypothetical protein